MEYKRDYSDQRRTTPIVSLIRKSDYLLEIMDARFPDWSRNKRLEKLIEKEGRRFIMVINKADLVDDEARQSIKTRFPNAILISCRTRHGLKDLRHFLFAHSSKGEIAVGVIGYPNTGKSSVINVLKGKRSAKTSPVAGFTKTMQKIRMHKKVMLWDTPGVVPWGEDEWRLALLGAKNPEYLKDAEGVALRLLEKLAQDSPQILQKVYGIEITDDIEGMMEQIALKKGTLKKGAVPDVERAARALIHDWQHDKLREW